MEAYAILKKGELLSMFRSQQNAADQLRLIAGDTEKSKDYALKKINIFGDRVVNDTVYSVFKEANNKIKYYESFCDYTDAQNKLASFNNDSIYVDIYYIESHPIFD